MANTHVATKTDWQTKYERTHRGKNQQKHQLPYIVPFIFATSWIRPQDISVCHRGHYAGLSSDSGTHSSPDLVVYRNEDWQQYKHKPNQLASTSLVDCRSPGRGKRGADGGARHRKVPEGSLSSNRKDAKSGKTPKEDSVSQSSRRSKHSAILLVHVITWT